MIYVFGGNQWTRGWDSKLKPHFLFGSFPEFCLNNETFFILKLRWGFEVDLVLPLCEIYVMTHNLSQISVQTALYLCVLWCSPSHDPVTLNERTHCVSSTTSAGSVRSPDGFSGCHVCRWATVAGLHLHTHSFVLIGQRGVQEGGARGGVGAWRQDPWRGAWITAASAPRHHGELVWACSSGVVQVIWWGGGLERSILSLVGGVCRVGGR